MIKLNGNEVIPTIFPDKTSQIWQLPNYDTYFFKKENIEWIFESESEFIHLAQLVDLLSQNRKENHAGIHLYLPYLPYGRQDKMIKNDNTFALRTFIKLLNTLSLKSVTTFDPHSDICKEIKNLEIIMPVKEIYMTLGATNPDFIVYPDQGAMKRYSSLVKYDYNYVKKERDYLTGEITSIQYDFNSENKNVLLVDDICDGGKTFTTIAEDLKKKNVKEVNLYVSHGIFSKGLNVLREAGIKRIFTKDGEVK